MEVDVDPQAFAERPRVAMMAGRGTVPDHPACAVVASGSCDNRVSGEARPRVEIGIDGGRIAASERNQIADRRSFEGRQEIEQQSRFECAIAGFEFDARGLQCGCHRPCDY